VPCGVKKKRGYTSKRPVLDPSRLTNWRTTFITNGRTALGHRTTGSRSPGSLGYAAAGGSVADLKNLSWVRAGHDPAIIYDPRLDQFEELKGTGLALGVDESYIFEENSKTDLTPEQIIAIGTDGIWETFNKQGEMFGKMRFREIIRENAHMGSSDILDAIYKGIDTFSIGAKKEDDITLVIIKLEETSRKGGDWQI